MKKLTLKEVQNVSNENGFEFISEEFIGNRFKHKFRCKNNHIWETYLGSIKKFQCPYCKGTRVTLETIKGQAKDNGLELMSNEFLGWHILHTYCCSKNHIWNSRPNEIRNGSGCPHCNPRKEKTVEEIVELIKDRPIELISKGNKNNGYRGEWRCKDCEHHWWTSPNSVVSKGSGCPKCSNVGISEEKCRFIFEQLTGNKFPPDSKTIGYKLQLDGYCSELNIAFEYQGEQHYRFIPYIQRKYENFQKQQDRDVRKTEICKEKNIMKLDIPYTLNKNSDIENYIRTFLYSIGIDTNTILVDWCKFEGKKNKLRELNIFFEQYSIICISTAYVGIYTQLLFQCKMCNHQWMATPDCMKKRIRYMNLCPCCGDHEIRSQRDSAIDKIHVDIKNRLEELNIFIEPYQIICESKTYRCNSKLLFKCKECGYSWQTTPGDTKKRIQKISKSNKYNNIGCPKCRKETRHANSIENNRCHRKYRPNIKTRKTVSDMHFLAEEHNLEFLSDEYINANTKHKWKCLKCGCDFMMTPSNIKQGQSCPPCGRKKGHESLRQYFKNKKEQHERI